MERRETGGNAEQKRIKALAPLREKLRRHENACKLRASRLGRNLGTRARVLTHVAPRLLSPRRMEPAAGRRLVGEPLEQTNQSLSTLARTPPSRSQWRAYPVPSPVHPLNVALRATGSGIEPAHAARAMQMTFAPSPSEVCAAAGQFRPTVATATSFQPSSAPSTW